MLKDLTWDIYREAFNLVLSNNEEDLSALFIRISKVKENSPLLPIFLSEWARSRLELKNLNNEKNLYSKEWVRKVLLISGGICRIEGALATLLAVSELENGVFIKESKNGSSNNLLDSGFNDHTVVTSKTKHNKKIKKTVSSKNSKKILVQSFKSKTVK